jgi:3,5-epimerase/4-reductase
MTPQHAEYLLHGMSWDDTYKKTWQFCVDHSFIWSCCTFRFSSFFFSSFLLLFSSVFLLFFFSSFLLASSYFSRNMSTVRKADDSKDSNPAAWKRAKLDTSDDAKQGTWLVFGGKTGWIGQQLVELLKAEGRDVVAANSRLEDRAGVAAELDSVKPRFVLNAAGLTGRPNVDWCEDHKEDVIRVNVIGTLSLCDLCAERKIPLAVYATGCIYEYDAEHKLGSGVGFTEEDAPNFHGSFYSHTKGMVEDLMKNYDNVLILRVRMPISDDLCPRNFITKISKYERVVNIPNSMTVLYDLLPISLVMAERGLKGVYNFTNPGVISHNEVLDLYKQYIDPEFNYTNFTVEEQDKILKAGRSNNELDTTKIVAALPDITIPPIKESMVEVFKRMKTNLGK